ncbi:restriction endonuclease subunit S [Corynebacteriaceae bacterium 7-707]
MPKQNVPALRLEGFSGEWGTTIVSAVADVVGGGTPSTSNPSLWDGDIDWYSPNEVGSDVVAKPSNRRITVEGLRASSAQLLPAHRTILYTSRASIGHTAILKHPATTNQGFQSLVLRDGMDTYFMYSLTPLITRKALKISSGSTFLEISAKALGTIEIPVPPTLEEQQAIGAIFTNLDAAINQHTLKHKALQQAKTALMQRMFPQEGQTVPELRLEGFDGEWDVVKVGAIADSFSGGTPTVGTNAFYGGDIPFIRSSEISSSFTELTLTEAGLHFSSAKMVQPGWVLYALYGATAGEVSLAKIEGAINQAILALIPRDGFNAAYLVAWLRMNKKNITDTYLQGGQGNLSGALVKNLEVFIPPTLEEQQAIGAIFTKLDQLIAAEAQYIESFKQAKTALLQRMFI